MATLTRWQSEGGPERSQWYIDRFRTMAAEGVDLAGEARFMDALLPPGAAVLDAGCGPGRVAGALHERGHPVVGVDIDEALIKAAIEDHPGPTYYVGDLAMLDLSDQVGTELFAGAVVAGNVMTYLAPGSESEVLRSVARHVEPDGPVVVGFGLDRGYPLAQFDRDVETAGLVVEQRFATWDLRPWAADADFAVSVLRVPHVR